MGGKKREGIGVKAKASAWGEEKKIVLKIDPDDRLSLRVEVLAEVAQPPARTGVGSDAMPLEFAGLPSGASHRGREGNNAGGCRVFLLFDTDDASGKSVIESLPVAFEGRIGAEKEQQKIHALDRTPNGRKTKYGNFFMAGRAGCDLLAGMSRPHFLRSPLAAYGVPFLIFLAGLALVAALKNPSAAALGLRHPEYWVYPLQTVFCAGALVFYWKQYDFGKRGGWGLGLAAGVLVLGIWVAPQALLGGAARTEGFDPTVFAEGSLVYWLTLGARFMRLVVIVPLVEELFWRGFLMRYLIRDDFTEIAVGTFRWNSFLLVAVFFMFGHQSPDWPAALACGVIYNFVVVRTGSLSASVLAHAVTNLGLGCYIMLTRQWGFW